MFKYGSAEPHPPQAAWNASAGAPLRHPVATHCAGSPGCPAHDRREQEGYLAFRFRHRELHRDHGASS